MHFRLQVPFADDDQITRFFRSDWDRHKRLDGLQGVADLAVIGTKDLGGFTRALFDRLFSSEYQMSHHAGDDR